jgi:hypothetical protein
MENIKYKIRLLYVPPVLTFRIPTVCPQLIYAFCVDLKTNSEFFPTQQSYILVFITEMASVY